MKKAIRPKTLDTKIITQAKKILWEYKRWLVLIDNGG